MALGLSRTERKTFSNHNTDTFTFLGEKILGIFAAHYEFAWDTPQKLNDQSYMVYVAGGGKRREEDRQNTQQIYQTMSQSQAHSGCGGLRMREDRPTAHTLGSNRCCVLGHRP